MQKTIELTRNQISWAARADFTEGKWIPTPYKATMEFNLVRSLLSTQANADYNIIWVDVDTLPR